MVKKSTPSEVEGVKLTMKVILLQKVAGLGNADDIKDVSDGYARNFLFPKHLAVLASEKAVSDVHAHQKKLSKEAERDLRGEQETAEQLDGLGVTIQEKASEKGQLYAAVGPQKISEALFALGFKVDKKRIILDPIKEAGEYKAKIKFRHGLEAEIMVIVSKAQEQRNII